MNRKEGERTENTACRCGSFVYKELFAKQEKKISRCVRCGLARTLPVPDFSRQRYREYSMDSYQKNKKLLQVFFKDILAEVQKNKQGGHLLEIGSGAGYFLELARKKKFKVLGLELSDWGVEMTQKSLGRDSVFQCELNEAKLESKRFSVVVLNHVLEHIINPDALLAEISRILEDDGILVIGSPNFDGLFSRLRKINWPGLRLDEHVWQFEPKTLRNILNDNNFEISRLKIHAAQNWRSVFTAPLGSKIFYLNCANWLLGTLGAGDNMIITAKKRN